MLAPIFWMIAGIADASEGVQKAEEEQQWRGFSIFLHVLLPVAGLALLWRQRGIFSKLMLQLDRTCVSVYCPSLSRREKLLKWASSRLPSTWSSQTQTLSSGIPELWKDGSLLCTLINSVVPGACPNPHRHWRKPPLHAQALAYKYLGLVPMFTEDELAADFTISQERNFIHYLQKLQEAINRWPSQDEGVYSSQYVARGMGLYTGEQFRKTVFYVYSDASSKKRGNVFMYIRGPYGTQGKATISPFHNLKSIPVVNVLRDQLEATKTLPFKNDEQKSFLKTISLDFTSLIGQSEDKNENDEIPIQIDMEIDRAKVTYIPNNTGIYEITLISEGELLRGSPYNVRIIHNTSGRRDSFSSEVENVEEKITFTKRKILSKVIDCIDEKICINDGQVSKIKLSKEGSLENLVDSDDDLKITAITKKKDEILRTEINCTLENIIEEINTINTSKDLEESKKEDALAEIKKIAENLKEEVPQVIDAKEQIERNLKVDPQHKLVRSCEEAKTEIINILQQEREEVDSKYDQPIHNFDIGDKKLISKLDINMVESTKYLKNMMNTTSRQEILDKLQTKIDEDENNNSSRPLKRITSKIYFEISPKNVSVKTNTSFDSQEITSPICPDHIVPEVEKSSLSQLSLAEKRKVFAKQGTVSNGDNCAFSASENESSKCRDSTFRELSVLNVLDSLRQSRKNSLSETCTLSSATSLPNMASLESNSYEGAFNNFKARKEYWERLSSRSSSSVSIANSDFSSPARKVVISKNFFNKFNTTSEKNLAQHVDKTEELTKSADNLLITKCENIDDRKYVSVDTSLEDCTLVPIEERKKQLLKNLYEQERRVPKKLNIKTFFKKDNSKKLENNSIIFSSVSDKIQTFDKQTKTKPKLTNLVTKQVTPVVEEPKKSPTKNTIKSQFKRAIKFFRNLEENSKIKDKTRSKDNFDNRRRFSLDFQKKNNQKVKKGGSLKLVSERFAINNLYEDVFGNRSGSFRGTPNKKGIASSLASLAKNFESPDPKEDENNISYNLFANKSKSKKRKSIKTLFDVNY